MVEKKEEGRRKKEEGRRKKEESPSRLRLCDRVKRRNQKIAICGFMTVLWLIKGINNCK
jgi:hypothetical protein